MTDGIPLVQRHVIEVHVLLRRQDGKPDHQVAITAFHEGDSILKNSQLLVGMGTDGVEDTRRAPVNRHHQKAGEYFAPGLLRVTGGQLAALQDIKIMRGQQVYVAKKGQIKEGVHQDEIQKNVASARFQSDWRLHKPWTLVDSDSDGYHRFYRL